MLCFFRFAAPAIFTHINPPQNRIFCLKQLRKSVSQELCVVNVTHENFMSKIRLINSQDFSCADCDDFRRSPQASIILKNRPKSLFYLLPNSVCKPYLITYTVSRRKGSFYYRYIFVNQKLCLRFALGAKSSC